MAPNERVWPDCQTCDTKHNNVIVHRHNKVTVTQVEASLTRAGYHECENNSCCSNIDPTWSRLAMFFRKLKQALSESLTSSRAPAGTSLTTQDNFCDLSSNPPFALFDAGTGKRKSFLHKDYIASVFSY